VVLFGRCRVVEGGGSTQRRLNQGEGMGKNKGRARRTLREEESEGAVVRARRVEGGLRTAGMARAPRRWVSIERRASRGGEGGEALGGGLLWARWHGPA
jgi:hypothetical protein